jgi:hypothetical protein
MSEEKLKQALRNWQNKIAYLEYELSMTSYYDFSKKDYINMIIQEHKLKINEISEQIKLIIIPDTEEIKEETKKVEYMIDKQVSYEKLEQALKNWQDKLAHFEYELSYTASAEKKFELKKNIEECEKEIQRLENNIANIYKSSSQQQSKAGNCLEQSIDYTKLESLLAAGNWREADEETARVICLIAGKEQEGWLREEEIDNFPSKELKTIDQLWTRHSNSKFGFSVQKAIYQSLGGTRNYNPDIFKKLGDHLGWRIKDDWLNYKDLNFNLNAPLGHLPGIYFVFWERCDDKKIDNNLIDKTVFMQLQAHILGEIKLSIKMMVTIPFLSRKDL